MSSRHTSWILVASLVGCSQTLSGSSPQSEAPAPKGLRKSRGWTKPWRWTSKRRTSRQRRHLRRVAWRSRRVRRTQRRRIVSRTRRTAVGMPVRGSSRRSLWAPDVVTDENGEARVAVTVPDTLTTWRVLALAHVAGGQVVRSTFAGSLPTYVDVTVPKVWTVGDRLSLPVQVVHEGADPELWAGRDGSWCGGLTRCVAGLAGPRRREVFLRHPDRATRFARHRGATGRAGHRGASGDGASRGTCRASRGRRADRRPRRDLAAGSACAHAAGAGCGCSLGRATCFAGSWSVSPVLISLGAVPMAGRWPSGWRSWRRPLASTSTPRRCDG